MTVFSIDIPGRPIPFTDTDVETLEAMFLDRLYERHFADLDRQS